MKKYEFGLGFEVEAGLGGAIAMLMLPHYLSDKLLSWAKKNINQDELYGKSGKGLEKSPHITLQNGIIADDPQQIYSVLKSMPPVGIRMGSVSIFSNKDRDYDVVKVDVSSEKLHNLNRDVRASLEINDPFGLYNPHITLAYVKKGLGYKFSGLKPFIGEFFVSDTIVCAGGGWGQRVFHLKADKEIAEEAMENGLPMSTLQDIESYLLDTGRSVKDLSLGEALKIAAELAKE